MNPSNSDLPTADRRVRSRNNVGTRLWWVTFLCLAVAIGITLITLKPGGPQITISFEQGHGLVIGDAVRFRGVDVGAVTGMTLANDSETIEVHVQLTPEAEAIAREGTQFWIERPELSLSRLRGIDTVVGAKYIGVAPGPDDGAKRLEFVGRETMPRLPVGRSVEVTITFPDGNGLVVGDVVKHRGIVIGEVTAVSLVEDFDGVQVTARLVGSATEIACQGSQFWIERPRVSVTEVRGLDTLVRGKYIAVRPGKGTNEHCTEFVGLDAAPPGDLSPGGLEVVLEGPKRAGLEPGAPVSYRGGKIGHVISSGLAVDAATVEVRIFIEPDYRQLVRSNTRFWSNSGFNFNIGFTGVEFNAETLSTIAAGGVSLATPDQPGPPAATGHRFALEAEPQQAWLQWQPRIPVGGSLLPDGAILPTPLRASLRWDDGIIISWTQRRTGWLLPLSDGTCLGPRDLLAPAEGSEVDTVLEANGVEVPVGTLQVAKGDSLAVCTEPDFLGEQVDRLWPIDRMRVPAAPEECVLVADAQANKLLVAAVRMSKSDEGWKLDSSLPITSEWHGGCVLSRKDGNLIGLVLVSDETARIVPLTERIVNRSHEP
ncbi:MlaD family protein [Thalassoroseus pseudoceratinae]|uniref:MlaD family protein n=1 Tax=Thalassoroseus pseudoceratinae TaxID=2713176 RepID=UPI00141DE1E4|nr:MlaD family protein [Thalassoroseus pseudoceratinae]